MVPWTADGKVPDGLVLSHVCPAVRGAVNILYLAVSRLPKGRPSSDTPFSVALLGNVMF
jgi:hypothetical protein